MIRSNNDHNRTVENEQHIDESGWQRNRKIKTRQHGVMIQTKRRRNKEGDENEYQESDYEEDDDEDEYREQGGIEGEGLGTEET